MSGFFLLFISCLSGAVQASAEELTVDLTSLSIEELMNIRVVSASRYEQPVSEAPSSVTVVTADEIKRYGHRTLADILKSIRGFSITYDRLYSYVEVRGLRNIGDWNSHILILVNGHRTNENVYDSSMIGNDFLLDVDLIDRVEIIRGPGSSLYGDNAFFAVINVITRNGRDLKGAEIAADAGSLNTFNGRMSYGKRFENGAEMLISGSVLDSQGNQKLYFREFDSPATNNGIAQDLDNENTDRFFSRFVYGDFALEGAYGGRIKKVPTASYGSVFNDPRYESLDGRSYLNLAYNHSFEEDLKIQSRLFYDWYWYHGDAPYKYNDSDPTVINKEIGKAQWWGAEAQVEKGFAQTHRLLAGADYQRTPEVLLQNYDMTPYLLYSDITNSFEKWAVFLQDEFRLMGSLLLNAGIRYDKYNTFGGTTNPRVGLNFIPREGTTIKLLYGKAFRAPNAYELYYDAPPSIPNPALRPERIRTVELVYEQSLMDKYLGTVSVFQNSITNLINRETDPSNDFLVYKNIDRITAKGIEVELERRLKNGWGGKFSYTFTKTRDDITGEDIVISPAHMAKVNLSFPVIRKNVFLGVEMQYKSRRETLTGQELPDYIITNLTLFGKELAKGIELSGSIYNVFDKKYSDPSSSGHTQSVIEQDGRGGRVKLAYRF